MGYHDNPPYFLTAYDIAVKWGFRGTEQQWLDTLKAFYLAVQAGFTGTEEEWTALLVDPVPEFQIGEVTTLDGGSMATASISGDKRKPVLNLGIPRGLGMDDALPLVGGTMKGNVNMNGFRIGGLPVPTENGQAVPKEYADKMLPLSGGTMTGALNVLEPIEDGHAVPKKYADRMLPLSGGTMTGALNVMTPTEENHAAHKKYVDDSEKNTKKYIDDKHFEGTVIVPASGWSAAAPYKQTVAVEGIEVTDKPHWDVVLSAATDTAIAELEAFAVVDDLDTADGSIIFTCLEEKPELDLTIQLEVNR